MPKVVVCMKQVVASDAKLRLNDGAIDESSVNFVVNPYDEFAIEESLKITADQGGEVEVVTLGPDRAEKALKSALALGAKDAYRVWGDEFEGGDILSTARALAAAVKKLEFDLVMCGKQAIDSDNHCFGPMLAEFLGVPHVTAVTKLEISADGACTAERDIEGGTEVVEFSLPAVVSADKGLNEPRSASLKGIMKVKKKKVTLWSAEELGLSADEVGAKGAGSEQLSQEMPPERTEGTIIEGDTDTQAKELARLLREEAKVL